MESRNYTITIQDKTVATGTKPIAGDNSKSPEKDNGTTENVKKLHLGRWISVTAAVNYAKRIVGYEMSQVGARTGQAERQGQYQFAMSIASGVVGTAVSSYIAASTMGPIGVAFVVGAEVVSKTISIAQRVDTLSTKESLENISLGLMAGRTGGIKIYTDNSR